VHLFELLIIKIAHSTKLLTPQKPFTEAEDGVGLALQIASIDRGTASSVSVTVKTGLCLEFWT